MGDKYVIRHGMTRKELLAQEGIEKLFYDDAVYNRVDAMMHTFEDRGHSIFMTVGFEFKDEHSEDARIRRMIMKLDDVIERTYMGVGILEYMDIEDGYVDYVRKITGVKEFFHEDAIYFEDVKGMVTITKSLQGPSLCIFYKYPEV